MANGVYNKFKEAVMDTGATKVDLLTDTIKVMLVDSTYSFDPDHNVDTATTGPAAKEISVTGYTSGFGGTGRKTLASKGTTQNNTNDRGEFDAADVTWTALGAGATIGGAVIYKHITNDASSIPIAFFDTTDTATNGGDITLQFSTSPSALLLLT